MGADCIVVAAADEAGGKPEVDLREVLNAIWYMTGTGDGWQMLPKGFPPSQRVYW